MKQSQAIDILKMGYNVFLTGAAGSGKTYILNKYISFLKGHDVSVGITASTGIAATHMQGITIHSWAGIGIKDALSTNDLRKIAKKSYLQKRFKKTKVLIIDEVSMLHHFRLDMVDYICRVMKKNEQPFGGLQIILCGDFFQLPPISHNGEESCFAYRSDVWQSMDLKICYLDEQHRHTDDGLLDVLNNIRDNTITDAALKPLRKRYKKAIGGGITPTKLYTHNSDVDRINEQALAKLDGDEEVYDMTIAGKERVAEYIIKSCLAPQRLKIKEGAIVIFVKNNYDKGYINGTLGKVVGFDSFHYPIVRTCDEKEIVAEPESWTIDEDGKILAEITQVPLRLAWAITVHKSQGMSLDAAEIDLSKSFEPGMGYVALSRVRTLNGLLLLGWGKMAGEVNKEVFAFDQGFKKEGRNVEAWMETYERNIIRKEQEKFLKDIKPKKRAKRSKQKKA